MAASIRSRRFAAALSMSAAMLAIAPFGAAQDGDSGLYSLPRTQDDLAELQRAEGDIEAGQYDAAVERLHRLLQTARPGVVPARVGIDRFEGIRHRVTQTLANLPPAGLQAYERLVERQANHLLAKPITELRDEELQQLTHSFPASRHGVRARVRLGDLALARGDGLTAQQHYRAAFEVSPEYPRLDERRRAALLLCDEVTDQGGPIARQIANVRPTQGSSGWTAYGGGGDGTRAMDPPIGRCALTANYVVPAPGFTDHLRRPTTFPMHAVGDLGGVFLNNGTQIYAIDPLSNSGQLFWRFDGPMIDAPLSEFEEASEAINSDTVLSATCNDRYVVGQLMVPNEVVGASRTQRFRNSINIIRKISSRRLFAIDRHTGKLVWAHWDTPDGSRSKRFDGHDICAPPIIAGDTVYVATHDQSGAIAYYLSAYDIETGEPRWRTLICSSSQEVNMFGNARQEFAAAPLTLHEGVVYGATNLGVCFAANMDDGAVRWISGYETIPLPRTRLRNQRARQVFFANNAPLVADDVFVCTPLDSAFALGVDIRSGRTLWRFHHETGRPAITTRWLLGTIGDEVIFSGTGIVAVKSRPESNARLTADYRIVSSAEALGESSGFRLRDLPRGAITDEHIYFVTSSGRLHVLDRKGNEDSSGRNLPLQNAGNLLLVDGFAAVTRANQVALFANRERLMADAERRVRRDPSDPQAHLRLATIALASVDAGDGSRATERAIEIFEQGLRAATAAGLGSGSPVFRKLADGHFQLSLQRAQQVAQRSKQRGIELLYACRDSARMPEQWIRVQIEILRVVPSTRRIEELETMRERYGRQLFRFQSIGRVPVAAYCWWKAIPELDAQAALLACQRLADDFGDVQFGRIGARAFAHDFITTTLETVGREPYAPIEDRARAELETAGDDIESLQRLVIRFPHSLAARDAAVRVVDLAVARGDLRTAAQVFASKTEHSPGMMRRMMIAAEKSGNPALARALGQRLRGEHPDEPSDFGPDDGQSYAALIPAADPVQHTPPAIRPPLYGVHRLRAPNAATILQVPDVRVVEDFGAPSDPLLFVSADDRELFGVPLGGDRVALRDTRFRLPLESMELDEIILCGETALVCEHRRVRGLDLGSGTVAWTLDAESRRLFDVLGVFDGVTVVFSSMLTGGDGGTLIGLETVTGTELYRLELDPTRDSFRPVASEHGIFYWLKTPQPSLVGVTPWNGREFTRFSLSREASKFLGIDDYRVPNVDLQTRMRVTADRVLIPVDPESDDSRPRCLALDHKGDIAWRWSGNRGQSFAMFTPHGDQTILLTANHLQGQLAILDRHGQRVRHRDLGPRAQAHNWSWKDAVAPDVLVITDSTEPRRLTVMSLVAKKPFFQRSLDDVVAVVSRPVVGKDFLALPIRVRTRTRTHMARLALIDLNDPLARELTYVPRSANAYFPIPMSTATVHDSLVIETSTGITITSDQDPTRR